MQVLAVKQRIEETQGKDAFPYSQQLLIYKGKVLKDETTMQENDVAENSFLVVMLTKVDENSSLFSSCFNPGNECRKMLLAHTLTLFLHTTCMLANFWVVPVFLMLHPISHFFMVFL